VRRTFGFEFDGRWYVVPQAGSGAGPYSVTLTSPIDIVDEAVSSLLRYDLLPGVINAIYWDASDLRLDL